jgi:ADP-ribose pyrophosphatase
VERWLQQSVKYQGRIFSVIAGQAQLADGHQVPREMVVHQGGVAIVPLLGEEVVLVRQFRIAIGGRLLELPAGRLEGDESPEYRARRELEEEAGYQAGAMELLSTYYSSAGFTNERLSIFLATDLREVGQQLESDENIELVRLSLAEVRTGLAAGRFEDAKTIIGLRGCLDYLERKGGGD